MKGSTTVLIIDDEAPIRTSLAEFLEDFDFIVETAESAEEALLILQPKRYSVAIVDLRLPGISGESFILQAARIDPHLRYLIHTGSVDYSLSDELRALGLSEAYLLAKPQQNLNHFIEMIERVLKE